MKMFFSQKMNDDNFAEEDYSPITLKDSIEKTRRALDMAYAGFDDAVEEDLIDSYIFEITALQKRYKYLLSQAAESDIAEIDTSDIHSPIRALVSHVLS